MAHVALLVGFVAQGVVQGEELNAFLLGMVHFFHAGRHFLFRTAVDDGGSLGTEAQGCAHGVHGRIAAAHHGHMLAEGNGRIALGIGGVHEVHAGQVFVARENARGVLAGNAHEVGQAGTRGHKHAGKALGLQEVFHLLRLAHDAVLHEVDTGGTEVVDFEVDDFVGQTELGYAIF